MPRQVKHAEMDWEESLSELGRAIADGDLEYVKMAIATGDDPNCSVEAPLFVATVERQKEIAQFLLEAGADPNLPSDWSCFTQAVAVNDLEWVEFLSGYGARVRVMIPEGDQSELHMAAEEGHLEMVKLLMEKSGGRQALERFDYIDRTPLIAAADKGQIDVVRYLLDEGADVNALVQMTREDKSGDTAISEAVYAGHVAVVELLLERGADPYRPGSMWINAWGRINKTEGADCSELERVLQIPELKRPAQTPHRQEIESQLLVDLKFHGCHGVCSFDWKATQAVGETFTVRGKTVRPFDNLRVIDEAGHVVAEGDVELLVLTREIELKAFWSRLTVAGLPHDLPQGVPSHIVAQLTEDQKSWIVSDRRNYCGRLNREDLDRVR